MVLFQMQYCLQGTYCTIWGIPEWNKTFLRKFKSFSCMEDELRERRKDRFTSFKKITWYSHTSLLVDSHWLEHRRMPTPAAKEIGSVVFNSRWGCVPLLWRKESKDNGLDNEQSSPQTPNDVLAKKFQTENSDLECQYDVNIFLR